MADKVEKKLDAAQKLAFDDMGNLQSTVYQPRNLDQRKGYLAPGTKTIDLHKYATSYPIVKYAVIMNNVLPKDFLKILTICRAHSTGKKLIPDLSFDHIRDGLEAMTQDSASRQKKQSKEQIPYLAAAALMKELHEVEVLNAALESRDDDELDEMEARQKHASGEVSGGSCFGTGFASRRKNNLPDLKIRDIGAPLKLLFDGEEAEEKLSRLLVLNATIGDVLKHQHYVVNEKFFQESAKKTIAKSPAWMIQPSGN